MRPASNELPPLPDPDALNVFQFPVSNNNNNDVNNFVLELTTSGLNLAVYIKNVSGGGITLNPSATKYYSSLNYISI
jgi:hypothetical protein